MTFPAPPSGSLQHFDLMAVATAQVVEQPPSFLLREDGKALFYPATINSLQGEPGAGKTWVAHAAGAGVVRAGGFAVFLDYEDARRQRPPVGFWPWGSTLANWTASVISRSPGRGKTRT